MKTFMMMLIFGSLSLVATDAQAIVCRIGPGSVASPNANGTCAPKALRFQERASNGTYSARCISCSSGTPEVSLTGNGGCYQVQTGTCSALQAEPDYYPSPGTDSAG